MKGVVLDEGEIVRSAVLTVSAAAVLLAASVGADAALFAGSSPAVNRFAAGTTDANPDFLLSGFDASGIAVDTDLGSTGNSFGATLISPQYVVLANHFQSNSATFRGSDGVLRTYGITADRTRLTTDFTVAGGPVMTLPSDVILARLDAPVDASITPLPILTGNTIDQFTNLPVVAFGQNNQAGTNLIDAVSTAAFDGGGGAIDSPTYVVNYDFDTPQNLGTNGTGATEIGLASGDSGNPVVAVVNGEIVFIGANFGVDAEGTPSSDQNYTSSSSFLALYEGQIQDALSAAGQPAARFVSVPEPGALALTALSAAALLGRRRRAAR